ncbi:hypothetical protein BS50DRAFT_34313 [Corynespora cassiicola Philippines]|uniref:Smr domain-containing protein n=1 Tax=Corynespora cassiicola Philippines TaxID=1448308 RepID=A0A2T2PCU9_CORCC|nr:hypothetical protein BS50DRAFT_34313 [Corynespora cassiicola Philippines]
MGEDLRILEQEFCPPLDPALVYAIYSDYAGEANGLALARETLEGVKQTAIAEQATDFDPSGSSGNAVRDANQRSSDDAESAETWASQTTETDCTSLSNGLSSMSLGGASRSGSSDWSEGGFFHETEKLDTQSKEVLLAETFPTLRPDLVAHILKKCHNDFSKATDELLNRVYLEDASSSPSEDAMVAKGIDAFAEEYQAPQRGRKGRAKRKQKKSAAQHARPFSATELDDAATGPVTNKWADGNRDIEFITSRTKIPPATVASVYHANGASLADTIMTLVETDLSKRKGEEPDPQCIEDAVGLTPQFPSLALDHAVALIHLAAPSTRKAEELASALFVKPGTPAGTKGGLQVVPRYAPVNLSDSEPEPSTTPMLAPSALPHTSTTLAVARSHAFTQASAAYRKGKSTPLMKAAAGYYAQVGRDLNANLRVANEADADALVASQSSATYLDLHGVSVASATRIAKEKTRSWWNGLGEERIPGGGRRGAGGGYRIVTGLGRHSEGGKGKIGPAVVRTLVKEGWKIEVGSGELVVMGRARK